MFETCPNCNGKMSVDMSSGYHGFRCHDCGIWISSADLLTIRKRAAKTMADTNMGTAIKNLLDTLKDTGAKLKPVQMDIDFDAFEKKVTEAGGTVIKAGSISDLVKEIERMDNERTVKTAAEKVAEDLKKNNEAMPKRKPVLDAESKAAFRERLIKQKRLFRHHKGDEYYITDYGFTNPSKHGEQPVATEVEYKSLEDGEMYRQSFTRFYGKHHTGVTRFVLVDESVIAVEKRIDILNDQIRARRNEVKRLRYALKNGTTEKYPFK